METTTCGLCGLKEIRRSSYSVLAAKTVSHLAAGVQSIDLCSVTFKGSILMRTKEGSSSTTELTTVSSQCLV